MPQTRVELGMIKQKTAAKIRELAQEKAQLLERVQALEHEKLSAASAVTPSPAAALFQAFDSPEPPASAGATPPPPLLPPPPHSPGSASAATPMTPPQQQQQCEQQAQQERQLASAAAEAERLAQQLSQREGH